MSINPPSPQAGGSNWTEPPWSGWIETTGDALLILEAARRGLIPRVTRRLVDSERKMITSGSVFVFDEDESGIKRWTDGFFWSPSRILGNFLLYRETDKRGAGHRGARDGAASEAPNVLLVNEHQQYGADGSKLDGQTLSRPKGELGGLGIDRHRERSLVGSLTNSYKFKPDGMMKKTFSLTIGGVSQHLISYYKIEDVEQGRLRTPSSLPELASLDISPELLDKTHFRNPPKVETGIDGIPRYRGESDESEPSPRTTTAPLSTGLPLLLESRINLSNDGTAKPGKRFDPYSNPSSGKRARKKAAQPSASPEAPAQSPVQQQQSSAVAPHPASHYPGSSDQAAPPPHGHYATYGMPNYYHVPPPGYPMHPPPPPPPLMYAAAPAPGSPYTGAPPSASGTPVPPPPPSSTSPPGAPGAYPLYGAPVDAGAQGQQQQQLYTFYPPPPGYPSYGGAWPQYPGYAAQQPGMMPAQAEDVKDGEEEVDVAPVDASGEEA